MPAPVAVSCRDLVVRYGPLVAVDGLDLEARPGEVLGLLGPNGAGKTSTVETLEGYRRPAAGSVTVLGLDPVADHRRLVGRLGVMLQRGGVYPAMGPRRALHLFARYYDRPDDPEALLARLGLEAVAQTPWRRLSGGEQQRLSLALALVGRPEVVFLDEPTAGVDPEGRLVVREVVADLRRRGVCVVLTTHELAEAERLADRLVIVDHGRAVAAGTLAELVGSTGDETVAFDAPPGLDTVDLARALGLEPAAVREVRPGAYRVAGGTGPARVAAIAAWLAERDVPLGQLHAGRRSLEDVYLSVTGSGGQGER